MYFAFWVLNLNMPDDLLAELLKRLPAAEWTNIRPISPGPSLMSEYRTVFAEATWLRGGAKQVFLKCIWASADSSSDSADDLDSPKRLKAICERAQNIKSFGSSIPIVPILDIRIIEPGILVQTLERVDIVADLIEQNKVSVELAVSILRNLAIRYQASNPTWIHFDICPRNVGVTKSGQVVFIDIESCYLGDGKGISITSLLTKEHLLYASLRDSLLEDYTGSPTPVCALPTLVKKYEFEVALVAAQVTLGFPTYPNYPTNSAEEWLNPWLQEAAKANPELSEFWQKCLEKETVLNVGINLERIADQLELKKDLEVALYNSSPTPTPSILQVPEVPNVPNSLDPNQVSHSESRAPWEVLSDVGIKLRQDRMRREEILAYRSQIERLTDTHPKDLQVWKELLLIDISFLRKPRKAHDTIKAARIALPNEGYLEQAESMIENWIAIREAEAR